MFLYYDADCDGSGSTGRWIFDDDIPSTTRTEALNNCHYHAYIESSASTPPIGTNTWRSYCSGGWYDQDITLTLTEYTDTTPAFSLVGVCYTNRNFNQFYQALGTTKRGATIYQGMSDTTYYMYWDYACDCDGTVGPFQDPRWVLERSAPVDDWCDLDGDNSCTRESFVINRRSWKARPRARSLTASSPLFFPALPQTMGTY